MAFCFAFVELLFHQVATCYFLGWEFGAHYWLIYLAGLSFFNTNWNPKIQYSLLAVVIITYRLLFLYSQLPVYTLDVEMVSRNSVINGMSLMVAFALLINYYSRSTQKAQNELQDLSAKVETLLNQQLSSEIAKEMISTETDLATKNYEATVMFLDIRDFTVFADSRKPEEVSNFQNIVFSELIDTIQHNKGVVLQLLGDGLMAVFGAPVKDHYHASHAVNAGYQVLEKIEDLTHRKAIPPIRIGIGLNSGNLVAGNIGNERRRSYSLTGKNVIIAARIEPLNKQFGSQFLVSESVLTSAIAAIREHENLGDISLKGIEKAVRVYKLA